MDSLRQQQAQKEFLETKIKQKIGAAYRDAFPIKYPGQIDHCLRLVMERLQLCLDKRTGTDPANPDTWIINAEEISELSQAAYNLDQIRRQFLNQTNNPIDKE